MRGIAFFLSRLCRGQEGGGALEGGVADGQPLEAEVHGGQRRGPRHDAGGAPEGGGGGAAEAPEAAELLEGPGGGCVRGEVEGQQVRRHLGWAAR